jgi:hypothetical protein
MVSKSHIRQHREINVMRKPILAIALLALFSSPTLASFAGTTDASSQQSLQGTRESSSSSGVSETRMFDNQPPLSKEAQAAANSGGGNGSGGGTVSGAKPAPSVANYSNEEPHAQVQTYVWTK